MQLLDDLRAEHERIDAVLGSMRTWAGRLVRGEAPLIHRDSFVTFFSVYAGTFHHEREEELLFPALAGEAGLPADRGPLAVLLDDHHRMAELLRQIAGSADPAALDALATAYSHALWLHIDAENSVLFPESERQLRRSGVHELPSRPPDSREAAAAALGDALVALYSPMTPDAIRGDGCVMCHAYGDSCRGLEREWWNEWEWDELSEHVAAS
jgi:hemerythrin-like domain-containing protein